MLEHTFIDRNGPTLLLIHGLGADRHCFDAAIAAAGVSKMNLLIPDLPGFGQSQDYEDFSYRLEETTDHLIKLCQRYGISRCSLVGHSMGGAIGVLFAEQFEVTHFINAVGNLVPDDTIFSRKIAEQDFGTFSAVGFQAYKDDIRRNLRMDRPCSSYPSALEKTNARAMYFSAKNLVFHSDHGDLLERFIKVPAKKMYLQDEDNMLAARVEKRLDEVGIARRIVPNTGHGLMEDNPRVFYEFVADFMVD